MHKPLLSILTPTYQRCRYLANIWRSLCHQNFFDFEWLIGIDGDVDDSVQIAQSICSMADFSVRVFWTDLHVGKSVIDNVLVNESKGKWLLWCDSDDYFFPLSLQHLASFLESLSDHSPPTLPSIVLAPLADSLKSHGASSHIFKTLRYSQSPTLSTYTQLRNQYPNSSDFMMCIAKRLFENVQFPEIDFYAPEGLLYDQFENEAAAMLGESIMVREYLPDGITRSKKILYPRAKYAVYRQALLNESSAEPLTRNRLLARLQYVRFALHSEQPYDLLFQSKQPQVFPPLCYYVYLLILIASHALYIVDLLTKRVIRTDKEFSRNHRIYKLHTFSN